MSVYTGWSFTKLKLLAVVYFPTEPGVENTEYVPIPMDISQVVITYRINEIPTCQMQVAIGREMITLTPATIHSVINNMKTMMPVRIFAQIIEFASSYGLPVDQWPSGWFMIFEGRTTGAGFDKTQDGSAQFTINITHWLADLNFSSALSRSTHFLTPNQLSNSVAFMMGAGNQRPDFIANQAAKDFFGPDTVGRDFWADTPNNEGGLHQWLLTLTEQDMLFLPDLPELAEEERGTNFEARNALNRFEPAAYCNNNDDDDDNNNNCSYKYGVPLNLDAVQALGIDEAIQNIGEDISLLTFDSVASVTIWDKLVGSFGVDYQFAVIPLTNTALVVPFTPGLRSYYTTIYAEEYKTISLQGELPRPLRGVGVFTQMGSFTGVLNNINPGEVVNDDTIGGYYENEEYKGGLILFKSMAKWLNNVFASNRAIFAAAPDDIKGDMADPGEGEDPELKGPVEIQEDIKPLWDEYARAIYLQEVLRGRQGTITGKIRFDIAPGSSVRIITSEEKFVSKTLGLAGLTELFGMVVGLTTVLNAEAATGYTSMNIAHIRSSEENQSDATSTDRHPLWGTIWKGAPLIEHEAFEIAQDQFGEDIEEMGGEGDAEGDGDRPVEDVEQPDFAGGNEELPDFSLA